jgi:hypothetical protein
VHDEESPDVADVVVEAERGNGSASERRAAMGAAPPLNEASTVCGNVSD